ncbi:MAG: hypothetical protein SF028_10275 [Candidatus Sumerlaeia bacterium]|nr:hypothetical protein [Candidatus Sumerlaeia bacterium]
MEPRSEFPLWLEWSGLPEALYASSRGAVPWALFRRVVELDVARNGSRPDVVEISPAGLAAMIGVPAQRVRPLVGSLRKAGLLRAFLPDDDAEPGLFQVIVPVRTPVPAEELLRTRPELANATLEDLRYATEPGARPEREERVKRVVDLYLDIFSMKLNSFVLDQLRIIAERYEPRLVERVFSLARKREAATLSWVLSEIRREDAARRAAEDGGGGAGVG